MQYRTVEGKKLPNGSFYSKDMLGLWMLELFLFGIDIEIEWRLENSGKDFGLEWRQEHIRQFGGRAVLVIRNPYKAIISYYSLKQPGGSQFAAANEERFARFGDSSAFVALGGIADRR